MTDNIAYHLVKGGVNPDTVVVFNPDSDNPVLEADSNHPHWSEILILLASNNKKAFELFDVKGGVFTRLKSLSDRVDYDGQNILWDGDVIDDALTQQIKSFLEDGTDDWKALVAFWEKIAQNPSDNSRKQLFGWLQSGKFSITEDGDIVGYKGVNPLAQDASRVGGSTGPVVHHGPSQTPQHQSIQSGTALVNGEKQTGRIKQSDGDVVSMPRTEVKDDPHTQCHTGLHVGNWHYASAFGSRDYTLEVHVNPRDVVSVPYGDGDKIRVCKYKVIGRVTAPQQSNVVSLAERANLKNKWAGDVGYAVV